MSRDHVEISKSFKDSANFSVVIEAGSEGWSIIWADSGIDYRDEHDSAQNNFKKAYDMAVSTVGSLREIKN